MRINEKMGLVYTALFLTVSVAVITQNSGTLMAMFRGESGVKTVDDVFTVQAGRDQQLPVLGNDVRARSVRPEQLHLTSAPECGQITQRGNSFVYSGSASCSGYQTFTYCLDTGRTCDPARVALRLIEVRDPIDSVKVGPATNLSGFAAQMGINSQNLEITNVHLGRYAATEKPEIPIADAKLAKVAVNTDPAFRPPALLNKLATVKSDFTVPALPANRIAPDIHNYRREASAEPATLTDQGMTASATDSIHLPGLQSTDTAIALADLAKFGPVGWHGPSDPGFQVPKVTPGIDKSPFGTPCNPGMSASVAPGALVKISIHAPCHPNSRVEIRHGKLRVTLKTDHIGNLTALIPAFEQTALFSVNIAQTPVMHASVKVPGLAAIDRVAIEWRGNFPVRLEALEFGAPLGAGQYIRQDRPGEIMRVLRKKGGFMLRLGDASVKNSEMAVIYSLPRVSNMKSGIIDFAVSATATKASCGQARIIQSFRSRDGRLVGASGLQFKMPACGGTTQSIVLKNVVRDLIIAAK